MTTTSPLADAGDPSSRASFRGRLADALVRGATLFCGAFLLVNALAGLRGASHDATHWLLDVRATPHAARVALLGTCGAVAAAWALRPARRTTLRRVAAAALALLASLAAVDALQVLLAVRAGAVALRVPPLSCGVAALLAVAAWRARRGPPVHGVRARAVVVAGAGTCVAFALALMAAFGTTDYRRPADAVVVLGARTYADGTPSNALADRVHTAAALVRDGYAPLLVVSGGPGDGDVHETEAMRALAVADGVDAAAVVADREGVDTEATARNVAALLRARGARDALVVSHAYHLPRVKSAFEDEGFHVRTVPAAESRVLVKLPWFVAREVVAWWAYWWRRAAR